MSLGLRQIEKIKKNNQQRHLFISACFVSEKPGVHRCLSLLILYYILWIPLSYGTNISKKSAFIKAMETLLFLLHRNIYVIIEETPNLMLESLDCPVET